MGSKSQKMGDDTKDAICKNDKRKTIKHDKETHKSREGHCNVPHRFSDNPSLGNWVMHQRTQYRYTKEGKKTIITEERIQLLDDLGFMVSKVNDIAWFKKYEELKQFKCDEGHCNVPFGFSKNPGLGIWVNRQRTQYKSMKEGKKQILLRQEYNCWKI